MKSRIAFAVLILLTGSISGCGWIQPPRLIGAGPIGYQQHWATRFDPYPDDAYGPEVVGGRPLGFQNPIMKPEVARVVAQPAWVGNPAYTGYPLP